MSLLLSKSDFKTARQCITKLYYKKKRYPSSTDTDPFMELLAEGGYMVGKLAQILYQGEMIDCLDSAIKLQRCIEFHCIEYMLKPIVFNCKIR